MNLNHVTVHSADVARSIAFYRLLGFVQIVDNPPSYARFELPNGEATFSVELAESGTTRAGAVVYFECHDLDETVDRLVRAGVRFDSPPADRTWLWREARLDDPDGNEICLYWAGDKRRYPPWRLPPSAAEPTPSADRFAKGHTLSVGAAPTDEEMRIVTQGLTVHALPTTGVPGFQPVSAFVRDRQLAVVGGVIGTTNWNWLHVALFWVAEPLRFTGMGSRLLAAIEREARSRGCTRAHLDTFSYQARPFYERNGYEVFATLDDYPTGHKRYFMRKSLVTTPDDVA